MSDGARLSIVLPCYNEANNIPLILARFREVLSGYEGIEVILVNNGSTDNSDKIFEAELAKPENKFARMENVKINQGYGFGIMSGVRSAHGEVIAWTHADMQTDPKDVLLGYEKMLLQKDLEKTFLKGRRIKRNVLDNFFTVCMSILSSISLGVKLSDINAQPKIFHRSFLQYMKKPPNDFSLDLYVLFLARKLKMNLLEQRVSFAKRICGESKGGCSLKGKIKLIKRSWAYIFKLRNDVRWEMP